MTLKSPIIAGDRSRPSTGRGTATIEFVLVFPVLLVFVLLILQFMLLMVGHIQMRYAAFCAARSAVVQIPQDFTYQSGEDINEIYNDDTAYAGTKLEKIQQAAAWALVPVSGPGEDGDTEIAQRFTDGLASFYTSYGQSAPNWVERLMARRTAYAMDNTTVTLMERIGDDQYNALPSGLLTLRPHDPVIVQVQHRLYLSIPYIRVIFEDARLDNGAYTNVSATFEMTNEGVNWRLPEPTVLPRDDD